MSKVLGIKYSKSDRDEKRDAIKQSADIDLQWAIEKQEMDSLESGFRRNMQSAPQKFPSR
jgi:NAD+--asparagine ADP-ribosyltransferase